MLPRLRADATVQADVFTRAQALAAGYSADEIRARLDGGWRTVARGVYSAQPPPVEDRARHLEVCAAIALRRPGLVVSHTSAALLHGLALVGHERGTATFTTLGHGWTRDGIHVRHAELLPADLVAVMHMCLTRPPRTVLDIATTAPFAHAVATADSAMNAGLVTREQLQNSLGRLESDRARHRAGRVVDFADAGSESAGESLTRVLMDDGRLPRPRVNVWIGQYRVDLLIDEVRVVVEFDGRVKYTDSDVLWLEKRRQEWLEQQGYVIVRVTWDDVVRRPQETLARIHAAVSRARRAAR